MILFFDPSLDSPDDDCFEDFMIYAGFGLVSALGSIMTPYDLLFPRANSLGLSISSYDCISIPTFYSDSIPNILPPSDFLLVIPVVLV